MASRPEATVISLHEYPVSAAAGRRARQRVDDMRRHPSMLSRRDHGGAAREDIVAVVREIEDVATTPPPGRPARNQMSWPGASPCRGIPAPPAHRRLRGRRVRLRRTTSPTHVLLPPLRPLFQKWFRVEVRGIENMPDDGGALVVANHSGTSPLDALMTAVAVHDHHPAHRRCGCSPPTWSSPRRSSGSWPRKAGHTLACKADAERLLVAGELVVGVARGLQGHRQAVLRALQAAAVRPRRVRLGRAAHRGADHPVLDRRRRGDLPDDRQHASRWPGCWGCRTSRSRRRSRWLGPLGLIPLPSKWLIEFGEPIATATTTTAAAEIRCWSSTSPTRSARPSSRRSTGG